MTPAATDLSSSFADLVARLRRAMRRAARAAQPSTTFSVAQLELLSVVDERPGARPGELAQTLRLAPNSVSTLANTLAAAGMLERASNAEDKRGVTYSLTRSGAAEVALWRHTNATSLASALDALTARERQLITAAIPALSRLVAVLDEQTDHPERRTGA